MKIAIAIETKDRRAAGGVNYLGQTLTNLAETGVMDSPFLHSLQIVIGGEDPGFQQEEIHPFKSARLQNVPVHPCPPEGCSRQQNGARAIRVAAATDADWVMKLEDDLDFCGDFLGSVARWLEKYGRMPVPMFALGSTFEQVSRSRFVEGESIWRPGPSFPNVRQALAAGREIMGHPVGGFWGAQALVWRHTVAQYLADWLGPDPFLFDGREEHRQRGHDLLLQVWGRDVMKARQFGVPVPSFVQHVGRQSNLNQPKIGHVQPFFQFPWAGRSWAYGVQHA